MFSLLKYFIFLTTSVVIYASSVYAQEVPAEPQAEAVAPAATEGANTIGEEPVTEDISRLFLQDSEVLLKPKEKEFSVGFSYSKTDRAQNLRLNKSRSISIPLSISMGLSDKLEVFASVPLLYIEEEFVTFFEGQKNENSGIGDVSVGLSYKLLDETHTRPSVTTSLTYLSATGEERDATDPDSIGLGSGNDGVSASVSLTKSVDPAVLFCVFGYDHTRGGKEGNVSVKPGDGFSYRGPNK